MYIRELIVLYPHPDFFVSLCTWTSPSRISRSRQFMWIQPITVNLMWLTILTNHHNFSANLTNNLKFPTTSTNPSSPTCTLRATDQAGVRTGWSFPCFWYEDETCVTRTSHIYQHLSILSALCSGRGCCSVPHAHTQIHRQTHTVDAGKTGDKT